MTSAFSTCGLNGDRQQYLVDILPDLTTTDPRWASTTTYQGVPWAQIRAGDLTDERADLLGELPVGLSGRVVDGVIVVAARLIWPKASMITSCVTRVGVFGGAPIEAIRSPAMWRARAACRRDPGAPFRPIGSWWLTLTPAVPAAAGSEVYRHDQDRAQVLAEFTTFARAVAAGDRMLGWDDEPDEPVQPDSDS